MPETTERTEEYRVVAMHGDQECTPVDVTPYLSEAERYRDREKERGARIQTRTVITTPWVDLDEGEGTNGENRVNLLNNCDEKAKNPHFTY